MAPPKYKKNGEISKTYVNYLKTRVRKVQRAKTRAIRQAIRRTKIKKKKT